MNVFYLHEDAREAARMHCDAHVRKMLVEYCQILSTCWGVSPLEEDRKYHQDEKLMAVFNPNHRSVVWARQSMFNYAWVFSMWEELQIEYVKRKLGKKSLEHKTVEHHDALQFIPQYLRDAVIDVDDVVFAPPPMAFGDYKHIAEGRDPTNQDDVIDAYRQYYREAKSGFATWTGGANMPRWYLTVVV